MAVYRRKVRKTVEYYEYVTAYNMRRAYDNFASRNLIHSVQSGDMLTALIEEVTEVTGPELELLRNRAPEKIAKEDGQEEDEDHD